MTILYLVLVSSLAIIAGILFYPCWRDRRTLARPFPAHWQAILDRRLPFFSRLSECERGQLRRMIQRFIAGKRFYGCAGLEVTDEMRVTIAALACLLLLNRPAGVYPGLRHILVYPGPFRVNQEQYNEDGTVSHEIDEEGRVGESWDEGKVILSWDDVEYSTADYHDGFNVVLHEFAHQLDSETGAADGAPLLRGNDSQTWTSVLSREFQELIDAIEQDRLAVMDDYGASHPAEFFAVATETFFEKPGRLAEKHPALFEELRSYYAVDPRKWQ